MPSAQRQVRIAPEPVYSRQAKVDEISAFHNFAKHASHCRTCANPYEVHLNGGTLCDRGHEHARNVAAYVYNLSGKAYSTIDVEEGNKRVQVEIPSRCEVVRDLLKAMERGLRLRRREPIISYDRNYFIPARPVAEPSRRAPRERIEIVEAAQPRYSTFVVNETPKPRQRKERVYVSGRGSLYASDIAEQQKRYAAESAYYARPSSRYIPREEYYDPRFTR
ncbi:MAG: hypothetical protein M1827_007586 [Pycnora praestabilis]|nr:MAG: hypothetical protein M1827_007586 [Pycnora praestabilis]